MKVETAALWAEIKIDWPLNQILLFLNLKGGRSHEFSEKEKKIRRRSHRASASRCDTRRIIPRSEGLSVSIYKTGSTTPTPFHHVKGTHLKQSRILGKKKNFVNSRSCPS